MPKLKRRHVYFAIRFVIIYLIFLITKENHRFDMIVLLVALSFMLGLEGDIK